MDFRVLLEQNPWWQNNRVMEKDTHLLQLKKQKNDFSFEIEREINLNKTGVYILRGPRQIGKTTLLKKLIKKLLVKHNGEEIFYFSFDIGGIVNYGQIKEILTSYLNYYKNKKRYWIFFDEVTVIRDWALGIKIAYDLGLLKNTTIIITGSSSLDIKKGGERLPGRRNLGFEADLKMEPLSFTQIVKLLLNIKIAKEDWPNPPFLYKKITKFVDKEAELKKLWQIYLISGGFPKAMNDMIEKKEVMDETYFTFYNSILGDWHKAGKKEGYLKELSFSLFEKNFEPVNWNLLTSSTTIGSHNTVFDYIETMNNLFLTQILYNLKSLGFGNLKASFKKNKKIYFQDPLLFHILRSFALGSNAFFNNSQDFIKENPAKLIETCILRTLREYFSEIYFWRNKLEIDFVSAYERKMKLAVEVKYQKHIVPQDLKGLEKTKGGILVCQDTLKFLPEKNILIIPAYLFL
jgi:predicted AAA+ superfamily ATPase